MSDGEKKLNNAKLTVSQSPDFIRLMELTDEALSSGAVHPKLTKIEEILSAHFNRIKHMPPTPSPKRPSLRTTASAASAAGAAAPVMTSPQPLHFRPPKPFGSGGGGGSGDGGGGGGGGDDIEVLEDDESSDPSDASGTSFGTPRSNKGRVIIFTQLRDTAEDIVRRLTARQPEIRPVQFIGQASKSSTQGKKKGLTQKEQTEIVQRFRGGEFNVLVATSIGEEGLDIGEVDLIIAYDSSQSPIQLVQRMGRTGRKRIGQCISLMMAGSEEKAYEEGQKKSQNLARALRGNRVKGLPYYTENPRMLPGKSLVLPPIKSDAASANPTHARCSLILRSYRAANRQT